jgi:roadblock/LC7 domain-containing protein
VSLTTGNNNYPTSWSRDGASLLATVEGVGLERAHLALFRIGDPRPTRLGTTTGTQTNGQISPDGNWLAYASDESGESAVYVTTFPDAAGKWQVRAVPESGTDTTSTNYVLTATADTTGWLMTFTSGVKVPLHVAVSGDSLLIKTGTFASQRRKNVKVSTEGALKLQGGKMVGTTIAHYVGVAADSVLRLHIEGTKVP